jgi:hypothetical protein
MSQCRFCNLILNSEIQRQDHENAKHPLIVRKKMFLCFHCVKILNSAKQREKHIIATHSLQQCKICRIDCINDICINCNDIF